MSQPPTSTTVPTAIALSRRVQRVKLSPVAAASARAAALAAQGRDIITLTSGEPDFDTPGFIQQAAVAAMQRGETRYTPTPGTQRLRQAISRKYQRENGLDIPAARITVANGAKQVIYNALAATLDEGDEVILPAPYWPSFPDMVLVNDGVPVVVPCDESTGFKLSPQALQQAITARTRWLILNSPGNPSGAVYDAAELAALAEVLRRHPQVAVLWDDVYEHIWFGPQAPAHWLQVAPDLAGRTLLVNGASKTYAMTGWRIGWGAGPLALIQAMTVIQSQAASGANAVAQAAVADALDHPDQSFVSQARLAYERRAALVSTGLNAIPGLSALAPAGAFFIYVNVAALIGRQRPDGAPINSDTDLVDWLLESEGVAVVDGSAYGRSPYLRLSFAASDAQLQEALRRIERALGRLEETQEPQRPAHPEHTTAADAALENA